MDNKATRHQNLLLLKESYGTWEKLAAVVNAAPSYLSQCGSKYRQIGDNLARRIEVSLKKPLGWMDIQQIAGDFQQPKDSVHMSGQADKHAAGWEARKRAREFSGLTQLEVAAMFTPPVSRVAVGQWEKPLDQHGTVPEGDRLAVLSKLYGLTTGQLLGHEPVDFAIAESAENTSIAIRNILAANILAALKTRSWSQQEFARNTGISQSVLSPILRRERSPTIDTLDNIAKRLKVDAWQLLFAEHTIGQRIELDALSLRGLAATDQIARRTGELGEAEMLMILMFRALSPQVKSKFFGAISEEYRALLLKT